jgi:copper chaperone CopZ
MRSEFKTLLTAALVILAFWVLVMVANADHVPGYISTVEIHVDGFVCATCVSKIENTLKQEEGVAEVTGDWEKGIVAVTTRQDVGWVNLFNFVQRINSTRNYTVNKMEVAAVGHLGKFPVDFYSEGLYDYTGDRYRLLVGDEYFLLSQNQKLKELISLGEETVSLEGTVSAFRERVPIMQIRAFSKPDSTESVRLAEIAPETIPDHVASIDIHVDGFVCSTCARILESNLVTEEGVASVDANLETGIVTVIPTMNGRPISLSNLDNRINRLEGYAVRKMDVIAVGKVSKRPVRYYKSREYTHTHSRYRLQVGEASFDLHENDKLQELLESGYDRVRAYGTVSAFNVGVPVLVLADFEKPEKEPRKTFEDPLTAIRNSLVKERKIMEEKKHPTQIDSVRVYVDGFICAGCGVSLTTELKEEAGVEIAETAPYLGLIEIVPKPGEKIDLFDVEQRINAMREYEVLKMDVVASGELNEVQVVYGEDTLYPEKSKRYRLSAGEYADFVLAENDMLKKMVESGDKVFTVIGTVTAYFRGKTPILEIVDYRKIEERPDWL